MVSICVSLIACLAVAVCSYWMVRHVRVRLRFMHADLQSMRREMELLASMTTKTGVHANRIERDCGSMAERVGLLELRTEVRPYDEAIDWVRRGADPTQLARQFGLNCTEAKLLTLVHGSRRNA